MCELRHGGTKVNGSIWQQCRDEVRRELRRDGIANKEMYAVLLQHGGCMNHKTTSQAIDIKKELVLVSE